MYAKPAGVVAGCLQGQPSTYLRLTWILGYARRPVPGVAVQIVIFPPPFKQKRCKEVYAPFDFESLEKCALQVHLPDLSPRRSFPAATRIYKALRP